MSSAINPAKCNYCGASPAHEPGLCPIVKTVEYYENGLIKSVTKFSSSELVSARFVVPDHLT